MRNKIFTILLLIFGIAQSIILFLFCGGVLRRIFDLTDIENQQIWAKNENIAFKVVFVFLLILLGLSIWGTIKKNKLLLFIPTILIFIGYITKLWW